jgi:hypothetical protein
MAFGFLHWPGLHLDAPFFAPVVLSVASGNGWFYDGYPFFMVFKGDQNYDFHGILHVIVYGVLLRCAQWDTLFAALALFNALTCIAYFFLYLRALRRSGVSSTLLASLFSVIPAVICIGLQGRPEQLAPLIIAIPFLLRESGLGIGAQLGVIPVVSVLLILLSPLLGALYLALFPLALVIYSSWRPLSVGMWKPLALGTLVGLALLYFIFDIFTPFSLAHWLQRTSRGGSTAFVGLRYLFDLIQYKWGFTLVAPLWNTFLLGTSSLFLAALLARRHLLSRRHLLALLAVAILMSRLLPIVLDYGFVPFIPVVLLVLLDRKRCGWLSVLSWTPWRLILSLSAFMAMLYLFVFVQLAVLSASHLVSGHSLTASRAKLHELISAQGSSSVLGRNDVVAVNSLSKPSLIVFGGQDVGITGLGPASQTPTNDDLAQRYERMFDRVIKYYVIQQSFPFLSADLAKVVWLGRQPFDLVGHEWSSEHTLLESLIRPRQLATDYRFALYRRRE